MPINAEEIARAVRKRVSEKRYAHTCRVRDTALAIAERWNMDPDETPVDIAMLERAALLHDAAKEDKRLLNDPEFLSSVVWGRELLTFPGLVHAPAGAFLAERDFRIRDRHALIAIGYHPTGHPQLDGLGHAIYLADYLEPGRSYLEERERDELVELAFEEPLAALEAVTRSKQAHVLARKRQPHPISAAFLVRLEEMQSELRRTG